MKNRVLSIFLAMCMLLSVLGGCGKKADPAVGTDPASAATTQPAAPTVEVTTDWSQDRIALSGSWRPASSSYPGDFPSNLIADEQGNLTLKNFVYTENGQLMLPEEMPGVWDFDLAAYPVILIYTQPDTLTQLGLYVEDHSQYTMTLSNGNQTCIYVREPDPATAVSGVDSSNPNRSEIWSTILGWMEGSWELINQDAADNYPAGMDIYNDGAPEINVLWQGSNYYGHWYVEGSCFCIDINDNFDQLMYHVELDENYLVMTRRTNENTMLMQSAYYYKTSAPINGGETEGNDASVTGDTAWDHDYQPGMENTMSSYTRPQRTNIRNIVRQDQMLYFVSGGILRKMPVGGSVVNVQGIYAFDGAFTNPKEIQVVGDWIYVRYEYSAAVIQNQFRYYQQAVARISTDGFQTELVVCDMAANVENTSNTFVVLGDVIYYTYNNYVQTSATQFTFYSGLKQYNMSTGEEFVLYEQTVERYDRGLEIAAYTEDTILLGIPTSSWGDAVYYLYNYDTGAMTEAPQITNYEGFYVDGNCYLTYYHDDDECRLYRYAPETGYEQELYFSEEYSWSTDDPDWNYVLCIDGGVYASTRKGIVAIRDGQRYLLTPDPAVNICWIGDGYIYYECNGGFYRILPDGTGWETVDWYIQ